MQTQPAVGGDAASVHQGLADQGLATEQQHGISRRPYGGDGAGDLLSADQR